MLFGGSEPHPVIRILAILVAQYENNLLFNVDRETPKHGTGPRRERRDRAQHELMRNSLALLDAEVERTRIAAAFRLRT